MNEAAIIEFFAGYAYDPISVYSFIVLFMTASSFGLPIPEEITLLSAGLVAHMAHNPAEYPPPYPGAHGVNLTVLLIVCFVSVLGSDVLIYFLGKFFGQKITHTKTFNKHFGKERFEKINKIFHKYSYWACGLFRFTPGVRFPGHLSCGLMGIPVYKFLLIDGLAALLSVPTQVYVVATYGEVILSKLKEFKVILVTVLAVVIAFFVIKRLYHYILKRRAA